MTQKEQDEFLDKHIAEFHGLLHRNIDEFKALVIKARPSSEQADQLDYDRQTEMYCELLKVCTALMSRMRETINQSMSAYRLFIDQVWQAICAGHDPSPFLKTFQGELEKMAKESWDPIFDKVNQMRAEITKIKRIDI